MGIVKRILIRAVRMAHFLPDRLAIRLLYRLRLGKWPNLQDPSLFTEKLQWLKLHDRDFVNTLRVDKLDVRKLIAQTVGPEVLVPLLGTFTSVLEMTENIFNWALQPMAIKCSHGSHCGINIHDQLYLTDHKERLFYKWMNRSWFWVGREWPYKYLKPKILCEKWIGDELGNPPDDYKMMCFDGKAQVLQVHRKRDGEHHLDFYDKNGYKLPFGLDGYSNDGPAYIRLHMKNSMVEIAEKLSKGKKYLRVDMYVVNDQVYVGELTLYDGSGFGTFTQGGDQILGQLLHL